MMGDMWLSIILTVQNVVDVVLSEVVVDPTTSRYKLFLWDSFHIIGFVR